MANRVPLVVANQKMRELQDGDTLDLTGNPLIVGGDLTPAVDSAYDLGTSAKKWKELHLSGNTLYLGTISLKDSGGGFAVYNAAGDTKAEVSISGGDIYPASVTASGNITAVNLTLSGDLIVNGTTTTINATDLSITDPLIHLADANEASDTIDIGFVGHYYASGSRRHTGLFRDASDGEYYLFTQMVDSGHDSSSPPVTINKAATDFTLATFNAGVVSVDSNSTNQLVIYDSTGSAVKVIQGVHRN